MITRDDTLKFSMEWAGPAGYWIELSGVYSFKPPSSSDQALFDVTRRAFDLVGRLLKPGARIDAVAAEAERVFEDAGFEGTGLAVEHAHGIGLNVIEPPLVTATESGALAEGMVISVHPGVLVGNGGTGQRGIYIQDNFEVSAEGGLCQSTMDHKWNVVG
jgi:Xaa-Pro aminopeptidase